MRVHAGVLGQELLQAVAERMDVPQGELVLVAVTYTGGKHETATVNQPPLVIMTLYDNMSHTEWYSYSFYVVRLWMIQLVAQSWR